ncbi:MAG: DUF1501 domain-containing protein [Planctomycetaceae bacterium]|nr:DUF1501 domain-containing protein [Planctomycetaceae bacterium]
MNTLRQPGRRQLLQSAACGFGALSLAGISSSQAEGSSSTASPLAEQETHIPARAKRVIFIFMQGGPSHVDTFDYKPALERYHEKKHDFRNARRMKVQSEEVMKSLWAFKQYGESGRHVSSLFPEIAKHVDELCFIHSMHTEGVAHGPSTLFLHTGATNLIRPSMGSWISYGLGTENQSLPSFVTVCPTSAKGGPRLYSNAFLPPVHQGTALGRVGIPAATASFENVQNPRYNPVVQQRQLDLLREIGNAQLQRTSADAAYDSVLDSYELAYRMQSAAPQITDLSGETKETLTMYGIDQPETKDFGYQCLRARRLSEAGVRFVQISYADNQATPRWDQHGNMPEHEKHAKATDKPVAGLLQDLKQRGLLEDTLVWWGGEFGRTPFTQGNNGRDHNPDGFTIWLAGGGVKQGYAHGETDEFGQNAHVNKVHMHDLHATILHTLGLDHERLTYRHAGRDFRLTDVFGNVVEDILA